MTILVFILGISLFLVFYSYFGYPILLVFLKFFQRRKEIQEFKGDNLPRISFIITAYNEEINIKQKLDNTLESDYPKELLEIIVASDCSSDKTDEIVRSYLYKNLVLVRNNQRLGKESAQKLAIEKSTNEILVFSDASVMLEKSSICEIVKKLQDERVGCISSTDRILDVDGKVTGENFYVKYEMALRNLESDFNSLVGLSGSFFAAKKEVCQNWDTKIPSDFNVLLSSMEHGKIGIIDNEAIGIYKNIKSETDEFQRKVRTILRGMNTLKSKVYLLNPFKYGFFSLQLFSHKILRWSVPVFLVVIFLTNLILSIYSNVFLTIMILQSIFYLLAILGYYFVNLRKQIFIKIPFFFLLVNSSILAAIQKFILGEKIITWTPTRR